MFDFRDDFHQIRLIFHHLFDVFIRRRDFVNDTLWIACSACGEVVRPAPLAVRLTEAFNKQVRLDNRKATVERVLRRYARRYGRLTAGEAGL